MTYTPFVPQNPIGIFSDGSEFEIMRIESTTKDGKPCFKFWMTPFDWTMRMLSIQENDLEYSDFPHGYLVRYYPSSYVINLSENPEKPIKLILTTFHGNIHEMHNELMEKMIGRSSEIAALKDRIRILQAENKQLSRQNLEHSIHSKEFYETHQSLTRPSAPSMLPLEQPMETEVKQKIMQDTR